MPRRKKNEKLKNYVKRCMPEVMKEGKNQKQAFGKCYGMGRKRKKK